MREIVSEMKAHGTRARPKVEKHDTRSLLTPLPDRHTKQERTLIDNSDPLKEKVNRRPLERAQHLRCGRWETVRGQQWWAGVGFKGRSDFRALGVGWNLRAVGFTSLGPNCPYPPFNGWGSCFVQISKNMVSWDRANDSGLPVVWMENKGLRLPLGD